MSTVSPPLPFNLRPDEASPEWMNKGDNAWQLIAATLVGLQSVPGLMILYGGAVKKKWAVNSAFMAFYAFACVLVCWVLWGYRMAFGDTMIFCWGFPNVALDEAYLLNPTYEEGFASSRFPIATMVYFQFVFAAITLVLIAGSLLGRMNFYAWMLFVPLWLTFSYTVGAFSIWSPKGFLSKARILDFAGGYVIHLSSGVAGFTAAHWVGPRLSTDREKFPPNNMLLMLAGAGLLWMGWSGFNGGATYAASVDSSMAILNTHVCTATSLLTWLILDFFAFGKASVIGAVHGMITGLVCITPAAGFVECWAAMLMGLCSGSIPWYTMMVLHKDFNLLQKVDDTMGVVHTHAIAGSLGGLLVGLFGKPELICLAFNIPEPCPNVGLFYVFRTGRVKDGFHQIGMQLLGIVFIVVLNVIVTTIICLLVQLVVPLRIPDEDLAIGDEAVHEEKAYTI